MLRNGELVRAELARILNSPGFKGNARVSAFLSHVVDRAIAGRREEIKEATIGVEVFGRPAAYDTKSDPIVRSVARVLREKLNEYNLAKSGGGVRIELPKGTYVPAFRMGGAPKPATLPVQLDDRQARSWGGVAGLLLLLLIQGPVSHKRIEALRSGDANGLYQEGRRRNLAGDFTGAKRLLERAAELAPGDARIRAALASNLLALGYYRRAKEEAQKAQGANTLDLTDTEILEVENIYWWATGNSKYGLEAATRLYELHPDRLEYGRGLGNAQFANAKSPECLRTIAHLRASLGAPAASDPQLSILETYCRADTGDYRSALEPIRRAEDLAKRQGARLLYARARLLESGLVMSLSGEDYTRQMRDEARGICAELGDDSCVLRALRVQANWDFYNRGPAVALEGYRAALPLARRLGADKEAYELLNGTVWALCAMDDFAGASHALTELSAIATADGGTDGRGYRVSQAVIALRAGQLTRVSVDAQQMVEEGRERGDRNYEATARTIGAKAFLQQGDLSAARRILAGNAPFDFSGLPTQTKADWLATSSDLNRAEGNLDVARKQMAEACSLWGVNKDPDFAARQIALLIAEGNYADAQGAAKRGLLNVANLPGWSSDSIRLLALLSDAYGYAGQLKPAHETASRAVSMLTDRTAPLARRMALIAAGRWANKVEDTEERVNSAVALANRLGFGLLEREARLALNEMQAAHRGRIFLSTFAPGQRDAGGAAELARR